MAIETLTAYRLFLLLEAKLESSRGKYLTRTIEDQTHLAAYWLCGGLLLKYGVLR